MKSNVIKVVFNLKTIEPTSYWSGEGGIELDVLSGEIVEGDSYHLVDYLLRDGQDHELAYMACVYDKENDVGFISFEGEHELEIKMGYDEKNDRINWYSDDAMEDFLEQPETKISRIVESIEFEHSCKFEGYFEIIKKDSSIIRFSIDGHYPKDERIKDRAEKIIWNPPLGDYQNW